jgi:hypothetical protein
MVRQRGAVDHRLLDWRAANAEVLAAVLKDHDCSDGQACVACGYRPTRRQPVCRSVVLARALRGGRAAQWSGNDQLIASEGSNSEQPALFLVDQ